MKRSFATWGVGEEALLKEARRLVGEFLKLVSKQPGASCQLRAYVMSVSPHLKIVEMQSLSAKNEIVATL